MFWITQIVFLVAPDSDPQLPDNCPEKSPLHGSFSCRLPLQNVSFEKDVRGCSLKIPQACR